MKKVDLNDLKECGHFAVILKCLLAKNNMTQGDLAKAVGMSEATITHYVKGKYTPSQKNLAKIAECLGVTPQDFYGDIDDYAPFLNSAESRFTKRLNSLLKEKKITQEQLAKEIGVSRQTICYYTNGKQLPMTDTIIKIAQYFGTTVDSFFAIEEPIEQNEMKILVSKMPESKQRCIFATKRIDVSASGSETWYCTLGGNCDLMDRVCSHLKEAN